MARMDRALANASWLTLFPQHKVLHLAQINSDHRPLLLATGHHRPTQDSRPFKFLMAWTKHAEFPQLLCNNWDDDLSLHANIANFRSAAQLWNQNVFGEIGKEKRRLKARIDGIQKAIEARPMDEHLINLDIELRTAYEDTCLNEELIWFQKARCDWISFGDRNTTYYQTKARARRSRNKIVALKNGNGDWINDEASLRTMAQQYFMDLYSDIPSPCSSSLINNRFPRLPSESWVLLTARVTVEEVKQAIFSMQPLKAPGIDGLHAYFFQSQWEVVGNVVSREVIKVFGGEPLHPSHNQTLISLIPKIDKPQSLKEFGQ